MLYEGDWNNNEPVESKCAKIEGALNDFVIYSRLEEIFVCDACKYEYNHFNLSSMKELKRIQIGDDCRFENVSQVIMDGCSKLEILIIGANCFRLNIYNEMIDSDDIVGELNIMNCLVLSSVRIESESFTHFKELKIESK